MRQKPRVWIVVGAMCWGWATVGGAQAVPGAPVAPDPAGPARAERAGPPPETEEAPSAVPRSHPADASPSRRAVVIDAAAYGIDPVVGQHVTERMRATLRDMGYEVLGADDTVAAAQRGRMAYPPAPADLWKATYAAGAARGAFARTWAEGGRYVIEVTVASLDGTGPFVARGHASASELHGVVDRLTREAVPGPSMWAAGEAEDPRARAHRAPAAHPRAWPGAPAGGAPAARPPVAPPRDRTPPHRFELALQTEAVIGTSSDRFYNHLLGLRLGFRINEDLILSAYVAYANLRGRGNRAHNLLPYLQLEHRVRVSDRNVVNIPLRAAIGYLPFNGPVIRLAAGLNFPLSDRIEVGFDLLSPSFWIVPGSAAVSFNFATELLIRL